ncbi:hypothetical protein [Methanobrevibacter arboriphilus]|uniref:Uncharacterized protein n=1 Tax=Methanobrevibacter arboriphilus TaxID=39441 RepID=A0ACA8R3B6_METAZ|nr:hypothetical protein [Methanobrevibacter arboriphilus]BBL62195.1 hypothetical protein MarbSA_12350 [Methanobrevibacter arboriphilus]
MSIKLNKNRNIEYLLNKYETKQPGEIWNKRREKKEGKSAWNMKQKIRIAKIMMGRLNINGADKERILYIIQDIGDFKELCRNCSVEMVIATICFYVMKSNLSKIKLADYKVFKENKLTEKTCLTLITKMCDFYQKKSLVRYKNT